jgi:hypothetical protein
MIFAQSLISLFIIQTTELSFPGTTELEKTTVSHFKISRALCVHSAILARAENCSHCEPVVIIICLCGGIHSVFFGVIFLTTPGLIFKYPKSFAIVTFSTIDLPLRKIFLLYFAAISISC